MKNLVVTLDINYPKEITDITYPCMKEYAENINADFKIINERKNPELPVPMEKFQLYNLCKDYDWVIFLDADCLINPDTFNFTKAVEPDIIIVAEYLDILKSKDPQFKTTNVMGKYNLDLHTPFSFLVFHSSQKNVVYNWDNPLQYVTYVNETLSMKKNGKKSEWHLDEFLLSVNITRYGINTASLKDDFPRVTVAHDGSYLTLQQKIDFLTQQYSFLNTTKKINYF